MSRILAGLALSSPVALVIAVLVPASSALGPWSAAVGAGATLLLGAGVTAGAVWLYHRGRVAPLVEALEQLAAGDLRVRATADDGGLAGRLGRAVNGVAVALEASIDAATVDRLTGVLTRAALLGELFGEIERANRYRRPVTVAFLDIDHFKAVNDTYGHAAGDLILRGVAQAVRSNLRGSDLIGRYGGEEFMLVLPETSVDDAAVLAEKLRMLVGRQRFQLEGTALGVTVSIGIAGGIGGSLRVEDLIRDADAAMYTAKSLGRNQTYVFAEPDEDARVPRAPISAEGRARALEIGRAAREAAQAALTAVIAPLPHYRGRPSATIATIVEAIAERLQLPEPEVERLRLAALLHDIGKVAVPDEILDKPGPLTSSEWRTIIQHPRIGQVILEQAAALRDAAPIVLHHHERYAGHGYPFGLRGNDIPLGARIVAIADAYDAMTHDRPYKPALSHEQAIREIRRHAGTQFDPELVEVFCELFAAEPPGPDETIHALLGPGPESGRNGRRPAKGVGAGGGTAERRGSGGGADEEGAGARSRGAPSRGARARRRPTGETSVDRAAAG